MSAASIFFVRLYGSHCIVMLDEFTWRAALVSTSVCRDYRSFTEHCSPDQHLKLVSGDSKQLSFTVHVPAVICPEIFAKLLAYLLQRALHNAYKLCHTTACKKCCQCVLCHIYQSIVCSV
ncbi:TPA: hypothetical protein ACH3X2_007064 [Trebouxia sp. C0005]